MEWVLQVDSVALTFVLSVLSRPGDWLSSAAVRAIITMTMALNYYKTTKQQHLIAFCPPSGSLYWKNNYIWNLKSQNTKGAWVAASLLPNLHLARRKNCQIAFRTIFQLQNLIRGALGTTIFPLRTMQLAIFLCFRFLMQLYFLYCSVVEPGTKCRCWSCHFSSTGRLGGLNAPALTFIGPR